jgi:hypothetical protein
MKRKAKGFIIKKKKRKEKGGNHCFDIYIYI